MNSSLEKASGLASRVEARRLAFAIVFALLTSVVYVNEINGAMASPQAQDDTVDWSVFLPEGEGKSAVMVSCSSCHDLRQVITQKKTKTGWRTSVQKMVAEYKAPVDKEDFQAIVGYLAEHFGEENPVEQLPMNVNTGSAAALARLPGISPQVADAIIESRKSGGPFASVEDLLRVKGVDADTLKKIRGYVTTKN